MSTFTERYQELSEEPAPTTEVAVRLVEAAAYACPPHAFTQDQRGITFTGTMAGRSVELSHPSPTNTRQLVVNGPSRELLADLVFARGVPIVPKTDQLTFNIREDRVEVTVAGADRPTTNPYTKSLTTTISARKFENLVLTGLFSGEVSKARRFGLRVLSVLLHKNRP